MSISALASVYHGTLADDLAGSLDSLGAQSHPADEIIIVQDGPVTSDVQQCLNFYKKSLPIRLIPFTENRGLGPALRDGLLACTHELIARVDTDDCSLPSRFERQVSFLSEHPEITAVGGLMREIVSRNGINEHLVRSVPCVHNDIHQSAKKRNPINHPTVMFRKNAVLSCGNYQDCAFFEDYYLWVRLIMGGYLLSNIPEVLVETHIDSDFFSRRGGISYIVHEVRLSNRLFAIGFLTLPQMLRFLITRIPFRLTPPVVRAAIYRRLLRSHGKTITS